MRSPLLVFIDLTAASRAPSLKVIRNRPVFDVSLPDSRAASKSWSAVADTPSVDTAVPRTRALLPFRFAIAASPLSSVLPERHHGSVGSPRGGPTSHTLAEPHEDVLAIGCYIDLQLLRKRQRLLERSLRLVLPGILQERRTDLREHLHAEKLGAAVRSRRQQRLPMITKRFTRIARETPGNPHRVQCHVFRQISPGSGLWQQPVEQRGSLTRAPDRASASARSAWNRRTMACPGGMV